MTWNDVLGNDFLTIIIRVLIALVLSGLIGFERELKNHSAGFRTHILVGIGACLMMCLSLYGFQQFEGTNFNIRFDPARIPSYVISGIGFLGAGTIIVYGGTIRGLTTAASIWTVAGLGLVVGAGMYAVAVFTTLIILLSLVFLNNLEKIFVKTHTSNVIEIIALPDLQVHQIVSIFEKYNVQIRSVEIMKVENDLRSLFFRFEMDQGKDMNRVLLVEEISSITAVKNIIDRSS